MRPQNLSKIHVYAEDANNEALPLGICKIENLLIGLIYYQGWGKAAENSWLW